MRLLFIASCVIAWSFVFGSAPIARLRAGELKAIGPVHFVGDVQQDVQISAVGISGDLLVIGADEGNTIQVLKRSNENTFQIVNDIALTDEAAEIDIEGIACDGNTVYVIGSHAQKRKTVDKKKYKSNRERLTVVERESPREKLFRLKLDDRGKLVGNIEAKSLQKEISNDVVLGRFASIPSKENGVDIEGLAAQDGKLFVGFRGPVLRANFVPVMVFPFADDDDYELRYVTLGGRGIRGMTRGPDGFLLIAGPVGDGDGSYQLYHWDGRDCIPGEGGPGGRVTLIDEIPVPEDAKAEGIELLSADDTGYDVLIVFDGITNGGAARFRVKK